MVAIRKSNPHNYLDMMSFLQSNALAFGTFDFDFVPFGLAAVAISRCQFIVNGHLRRVHVESQNNNYDADSIFEAKRNGVVVSSVTVGAGINAIFDNTTSVPFVNDDLGSVAIDQTAVTGGLTGAVTFYTYWENHAT